MANDLVKFIGDVENAGVNTYTPDFSPNIQYKEGTKNVSPMTNFGVGPRYGMSPIPGQQHTENSASTEPVGLRQTEDAGNLYSYFNRKRVYGIVPISEFFPGTGFTAAQKYYVWIVGADNAGITNTDLAKRIDFLISSVQSSTFTYPYPDVASALNYAVEVFSGNPHIQRAGEIVFAHVNTNDNALIYPDVLRIFQQAVLPSAVSFTQFTVSGQDIPNQWFQAYKLADGTASKTAVGSINGVAGGSGVYLSQGIPSAINLNNYKFSTRFLKFYNLALNPTYGIPQFLAAYEYNNTHVDSTTYNTELDNTFSVSNPNTSALVFTNREDKLTGINTNYAIVTNILANDPEMTTNSGYKAIFAAGDNPIAAVIQGWQRGKFGYPFQVIEVSNMRLRPKTTNTGDLTASGQYKEDGIATSTSWANWFPFSSTGSPPPVASTNPRALPTLSTANSVIALGDIDSGVLRANTIYEFTYSLFDKTLGIESNVGVPAKILTGDVDNVAISLFRDVFSGGIWQQFTPLSASNPLPTNDTNIYPLNSLEYRIYYREFGSFEWLPALFIDAAKYTWYPNFQNLWMCQAPIAALPGGQPGGFIDNSNLPKDNYNCVLTFKNRVVWLSQSNLVFSLANNGFVYPLRNSAPAPTGGYRGAIIHTYRGQSQQESRLIIFGGQETYIGIFTGQLSQMPIVISPDVTANYDVDGSDFRVETWTSVTAFSYRSAVVADGVLYWWGAQGIYRDNGVDVPDPIHDPIKPFIFDCYSQAYTNEIHATYNNQTKEIIWFYRPKSNTDISKSIVYNTLTQKFFFEEFGSLVDWSQQIDTNGVAQDTNGLRTLIGARDNTVSTPQRAYFFDPVNRSGDLKPATEFLIKKVEDGVSTGLKKITLATGFDATNFATFAATNRIAIQQFKKYSGQATGDDMIAELISRNTGAGTFVIKLPDGAVLPNVTLSAKTYAPFWHATKTGQGLNGISWELQTGYWMPGLSGRQLQTGYWMPGGGDNFYIWEWIYLFFKYTTWKKILPNQFDFAHRTPTSNDYISAAIELLDNSDTNCQVYHPLNEGNVNNQGQALKMKLSGIHIGEEWMLQYLEAHNGDQSGNLLKDFQG